MSITPPKKIKVDIPGKATQTSPSKAIETRTMEGVKTRLGNTSPLPGKSSLPKNKKK